MHESHVKEERDFFNSAVNGERRTALSRFYPSNERIVQYWNTLLESYCGAGKKILDYGCGEGWNAFHISQWGGQLHGIDIADEQIARAQRRAREVGLDSKVSFEVMDGEMLTYPDQYFDAVCGTGILHHLNIEKAMREISRVLKSDGCALFMEPMGTNGAINLFRHLTPRHRTRGEHPLRADDFKKMEEFFEDGEYTYFDALTFFGMLFNNTRHEKKVTTFLDSIDRKIFALLSPTRLLAWRSVIVLRKPRIKKISPSSL